MPILRLMRPTHWVKNVFVLAPVVFAHRLNDPEALGRALLAMALFCLASSAVYAFNDVRDRELDRRHPVKRDRPVASGAVSVGAAVALAVALAAVAGGGSLWLEPLLGAIVLGYLAINLLYTVWLKHVVILDVMVISSGFVLRVLGGAVAIDVAISSWLILCTIFLALFLAFSKRRHELAMLAGAAAEGRRVLSHYSETFLDQMINVVTAGAVLSYALYSVSPETVERFGNRLLLATIPFVLFGIFRYLYLIYQRPTRQSPTEAIVRDLPSVVNVGLWGLAVVWAVYLA